MAHVGVHPPSTKHEHARIEQYSDMIHTTYPERQRFYKWRSFFLFFVFLRALCFIFQASPFLVALVDEGVLDGNYDRAGVT